MTFARSVLALLLVVACGKVEENPNGDDDAPLPPPEGPIDAPPATPTLFWVEAPAACDASVIRKMPIDSTTPADVISLPSPDQIADLNVEQSAGRIFYTFGQSSANNSETVERVNIDGTGHVTIKTYSPRPTPLGVTVDSSTDTVYWLTNGGCSPCPSCGACSTIENARSDGANSGLTHTLTGTANPRMLTFDSQARKLYFCDLQFPPHISRVNLDGTGLESVFTRPTSEQGGVDDVEIDIAGRKLYWLESALQIGPSVRIQRSDLDGTNVQALANAGGSMDRTPRGLAVDTAGGKIYWTESGFCGGAASGRIQRANLDGTNIETVVGGLGVLIAIDIVR